MELELFYLEVFNVGNHMLWTREEDRNWMVSLLIIYSILTYSIIIPFRKLSLMSLESHMWSTFIYDWWYRFLIQGRNLIIPKWKSLAYPFNHEFLDIKFPSKNNWLHVINLVANSMKIASGIRNNSFVVSHQKENLDAELEQNRRNKQSN